MFVWSAGSSRDAVPGARAGAVRECAMSATVRVSTEDVAAALVTTSAVCCCQHRYEEAGHQSNAGHTDDAARVHQ